MINCQRLVPEAPGPLLEEFASDFAHAGGLYIYFILFIYYILFVRYVRQYKHTLFNIMTSKYEMAGSDYREKLSNNGVATTTTN